LARLIQEKGRFAPDGRGRRGTCLQFIPAGSLVVLHPHVLGSRRSGTKNIRKDATYASKPIRPHTVLETKSLESNFQLRDKVRPSLRTRGTSEPFTIIEIDEARLLRPRHALAKVAVRVVSTLVETAPSKAAQRHSALIIFLSENGGTIAG